MHFLPPDSAFLPFQGLSSLACFDIWMILSKIWRLWECFGFIFGPNANKANIGSFWGWKPPCEASRTTKQCLSCKKQDQIFLLVLHWAWSLFSEIKLENNIFTIPRLESLNWNKVRRTTHWLGHQKHILPLMHPFLENSHQTENWPFLPFYQRFLSFGQCAYQQIHQRLTKAYWFDPLLQKLSSIWYY